MREFWSAVTEGPGVQTLYPHEVGADKRTDTVIVRHGSSEHGRDRAKSKKEKAILGSRADARHQAHNSDNA